MPAFSPLPRLVLLTFPALTVAYSRGPSFAFAPFCLSTLCTFFLPRYSRPLPSFPLPPAANFIRCSFWVLDSVDSTDLWCCRFTWVPSAPLPFTLRPTACYLPQCPLRLWFRQLPCADSPLPCSAPSAAPLCLYATLCLLVGWFDYPTPFAPWQRHCRGTFNPLPPPACRTSPEPRLITPCPFAVRPCPSHRTTYVTICGSCPNALYLACLVRLFLLPSFPFAVRLVALLYGLLAYALYPQRPLPLLPCLLPPPPPLYRLQLPCGSCTLPTSSAPSLCYSSSQPYVTVTHFIASASRHADALYLTLRCSRLGSRVLYRCTATFPLALRLDCPSFIPIQPHLYGSSLLPAVHGRTPACSLPFARARATTPAVVPPTPHLQFLCFLRLPALTPLRSNAAYHPAVRFGWVCCGCVTFPAPYPRTFAPALPTTFYLPASFAFAVTATSLMPVLTTTQRHWYSCPCSPRLTPRLLRFWTFIPCSSPLLVWRLRALGCLPICPTFFAPTWCVRLLLYFVLVLRSALQLIGCCVTGWFMPYHPQPCWTPSNLPGLF